MSIKQVLTDFQIVQESLKGSELRIPSIEAQTYQLTCHVQCLTSQEVLRKKILDFKASQGWISAQSGNYSFQTNSSIQPPEEYGYWLNAELAKTNAALHIRYDGQGNWLVTEYIFEVSEQGTYIADKVSHIASKDELSRLNYLRFWHLESQKLGLTPAHACFIGFGA